MKTKFEYEKTEKGHKFKFSYDTESHNLKTILDFLKTLIQTLFK